MIRYVIMIIFVLNFILTPTSNTTAAAKSMTKKEAYQGILKAINNLQDKVTLTNYKEKEKNELFGIANQVIDDHYPMYKYVYIEDVESRKTVKFHYMVNKTELKKIIKQPVVNQDFFLSIIDQKREIDKEIKNMISKNDLKRLVNHQNSILKEAKKQPTNLEKIKYVHDYIMNHTKYDLDNYYKKTVPKSSHTPNGPLLYGTAVCDGYSTTMSLLLNKLNIPTLEVEGKAGDGIAHSWNLIYLDGEFYYLDATFDDENDHNFNYNYFLVPQNMLSKDHYWVVAQYPKAVSTKYVNFQEQVDKSILEKNASVFSQVAKKYNFSIKPNALEDKNGYRSYIVSDNEKKLSFSFEEYVSESVLNIPFSNEANFDENYLSFVKEVSEKLSSTKLPNLNKTLEDKMNILITNNLSKKIKEKVNSNVSYELNFRSFDEGLWNLELTINIKFK
ncbi:transglutaminase domain-containing protein [Neobacillus sp. D3-1R]|uniref:transglutaminase domain-containing protein n=1 Tax=Neobacillus sp. D3-1R TaxID=3445778 RepID=UPI003FA00FD0